MIEYILLKYNDLNNHCHFHLHTADIAFMWVAYAFTKKDRTVIAQCEKVMASERGKSPAWNSRCMNN
ncbi:putative metallopeptidase [Pectobacterium brasiliense]|uniref:putative metallopeptidase n=1 Tax=Pectobacterium brasiliense TaxID=180957 RepID=UPI003899C19D